LCLGFINREKEAAEMFQKVINVKPDKASAYISLSKLYLLMNDNDKALQILNDALNKIPRDSAIYYQLGLIYKTRDMKNESKKAFQMCVSLGADPEKKVKALSNIAELSK